MKGPDGEKAILLGKFTSLAIENVVYSAINGQQTMAALIQRTAGRQNLLACLTFYLNIILLEYRDIA